MSRRPRVICLVGAGPRGLSVLERLCAQERTAGAAAVPLTVHVVDPYPPGAGAVWRTDQSRRLLMNTVSSQITVFTDHTSRIDGPIEPGPSLHAWASAGPEEEGPARAEARGLGPDDYPTRALYGAYLRAVFRRVVRGAPAHVTVETHRSRAVELTEDRPGGAQSVRLADGRRLTGLDAVVLAQGHVPVHPRPEERRTAGLARDLGLTYLAPGNPADADLKAIGPGEPVLLRGLGLNFFDYQALLTEGRGGAFARVGERLVYHPSGREPRLYASSRRGIPYHARGRNEKGVAERHLPRLLTPELIARLRERTEKGEPVRFGAELWPLIAVEVEAVYYGTLLQARGRGAERAEFTRRFLDAADAAERAAVLDAYGIAAADRWDWGRLSRPTDGRRFADRDDFRRWLLEHLARDVAAARAGNVGGPLKAALDVLRDLRNEVRQLVDHGGLEGGSYRDELAGWYTPLNAYLSIGPPASRIEEMIALIEAGVLELTGPGTEIRVDTARPAFVATSERVPGPPVRCSALIEARLHEPDLRRTADPLLLRLVRAGAAVPYRIGSTDGGSWETGGLAVTERPYRLVEADGRAHPRRFAYGVPTEYVHWVTAAGIRPGVDSVTLGDSDAIARAIRQLPSPEGESETPVTDSLGVNA
ncbi:FAD/NAD(P)-binding protein [Streptomyces sp. LX-29]|uniref:FAD/NAD(P)-binding protein n=1 Tax=Streptomyces sp. LX-29 TaxID=2900152 RepID=UPI00240D6EC3|nr:FAD/NAD(P)-binding protein [Streptomyces sp. LX-29]WFB10765.1 FAD/NAD(P)-binding protein [Streptomyces sp. LX-29]